jgi:hypothetical protein
MGRLYNCMYNDIIVLSRMGRSDSVATARPAYGPDHAYGLLGVLYGLVSRHARGAEGAARRTRAEKGLAAIPADGLGRRSGRVGKGWRPAQRRWRRAGSVTVGPV